MDVLAVPDDVWIEIFEAVDDSAQLAALMRTCRHFHALAMKPLLRHIRWTQPPSTMRNFNAWKTVYKDYSSLVRKITLGIPFELLEKGAGWRMMTLEKYLFDEFHALLPTFASLNELVMENTSICPYTYRVLLKIPTLRSLTVRNCKFHEFDRSFAQYKLDATSTAPFSGGNPNDNGDNDEPFSFAKLPLTKLSIHKITMPLDSPELHPLHPLLLASIPTLTSLSLTWNTSQSTIYTSTLHPSSSSASAGLPGTTTTTGSNTLAVQWSLPHLRYLSITMPHLTRDLVDSLVLFVNRLECQCHPSPDDDEDHIYSSPSMIHTSRLKVDLTVERHSLSDQQIGTLSLPLRGVWKFKGPLPIAAFASPTVSILASPSPSIAAAAAAAAAAALGQPSASSVPLLPTASSIEKQTRLIAREDPSATLVHMVMNEPMELGALVEGLEALPRRLQTLEVQMRRWDVELLFAVRALFPEIREVVIRYGKGNLPANLLEKLGSDILFDLPRLTTFKILFDPSCTVTTRHQLGGFHVHTQHQQQQQQQQQQQVAPPPPLQPPISTTMMQNPFQHPSNNHLQHHQHYLHYQHYQQYHPLSFPSLPAQAPLPPPPPPPPAPPALPHVSAAQPTTTTTIETEETTIAAVTSAGTKTEFEMDTEGSSALGGQWVVGGEAILRPSSTSTPTAPTPPNIGGSGGKTLSRAREESVDEARSKKARVEEGSETISSRNKGKQRAIPSASRSVVGRLDSLTTTTTTTTSRKGKERGVVPPLEDDELDQEAEEAKPEDIVVDTNAQPGEFSIQDYDLRELALMYTNDVMMDIEDDTMVQFPLPIPSPGSAPAPLLPTTDSGRPSGSRRHHPSRSLPNSSTQPPSTHSRQQRQRNPRSNENSSGIGFLNYRYFPTTGPSSSGFTPPSTFLRRPIPTVPTPPLPSYMPGHTPSINDQLRGMEDLDEMLEEGAVDVEVDATCTTSGGMLQLEEDAMFGGPGVYQEYYLDGGGDEDEEGGSGLAWRLRRQGEVGQRVGSQQRVRGYGRRARHGGAIRASHAYPRATGSGSGSGVAASSSPTSAPLPDLTPLNTEDIDFETDIDVETPLTTLLPSASPWTATTTTSFPPFTPLPPVSAASTSESTTVDSPSFGSSSITGSRSQSGFSGFMDDSFFSLYTPLGMPSSVSSPPPLAPSSSSSSASASASGPQPVPAPGSSNSNPLTSRHGAQSFFPSAAAFLPSIATTTTAGAAAAAGSFLYTSPAPYVASIPFGPSFESNTSPNPSLPITTPNPASNTTSNPNSTSTPQRPRTGIEYRELKDYLTGWNRYCRNLRCFQLQDHVWWERRFEGDRWVERTERGFGALGSEPSVGSSSMQSGLGGGVASGSGASGSASGSGTGTGTGGLGWGASVLHVEGDGRYADYLN